MAEYLSPFVGRLAFGWFYLSQVAYYGEKWHDTVLQMMLAGVVLPQLVLAVTLLLVVMGAVSLIFGFHARYGALLLFAVTIVAAVLMHDYWHVTNDPGLRQAHFELFACYAAIAGGLLLLVGQGPGPLAIDNRPAAPNPKKK